MTDGHMTTKYICTSFMFLVEQSINHCITFNQDVSQVLVSQCDIQEYPEPRLRKSHRTGLSPGHPEQATVGHKSYRVYRTDADPWANWRSEMRIRQPSIEGELNK